MYVTLSIICINVFGQVGASYAFFINYTLYAVFVMVFVGKYLRNE